MDLTGANLNALFTNWVFLYDEGFANYPPWYPDVAEVIPSDTERNIYPMIADIPQVREWVGPRIVQNIATRDYTLANKDYELTETIPRNKILDDQYGVYSRFPKNMGQQMAVWPDQQLAAMIQSNPVGFDNVAFFSASHPNTSGLVSAVQSNLFALALNATALGTVMANMASIKRDNGQPLLVRPTHLLVPPQLELTARTLMNSVFIALPTIQNLTSLAGSTSNPFQGLFKVVVVPQWANEPTTWVLADCSKPIRPFIWQLRQAPQFIYRNQPTDDNVFWNKDFVYGADSRGAPGVSLWFLAAKSVG